MIRLFILLYFSFVLFFTSNAQIEIGAKIGLSSYDLVHEGLLIKNNQGILEWNTQNAGYGHHLGAYMRLSFLGLYLEPALLFNSNSVDHNITYYSESGVINAIKNERYNHLDLPLNLGFKLGALRFHGGVVGHFLINRVGDVFEWNDYSQKLQNATYGWQMGTGVDIWRIRLDLSYEGGFDRFGDEIIIKNQAYQFDKNPGRLILSFGFKIF